MFLIFSDDHGFETTMPRLIREKSLLSFCVTMREIQGATYPVLPKCNHFSHPSLLPRTLEKYIKICSSSGNGVL